MQALQPNPNGVSSRSKLAAEKQPRRLVLALVLLLVALGGVVIKDRQFWFGSDDNLLDSDATETTTQTVAKTTRPVATHAAPTVKKSTSAARNDAARSNAAKTEAAKTEPTKTEATKTEAKAEAAPKTADAPAVTTTRTALAPLDVEVVAGDSHRTVRPGSNAAKLEITRPAAPAAAPATNAAQRESLPADAVQPYPLLAQQMKVQGSVVLQALIGANGVIENLRVLSGPAILSTAAQQAVHEWRFKPIMENGQAVESKARITVNFTIKIADGTAKTTLAESRPLIIEDLSR